MDAQRYRLVQDVFWAAESVPLPQRHAWLVDRCGTDVALRREVESLLAEHDPDAALKEGHEARPASLPPGTAGRGLMPPGPAPPATDQATVHGSQRTHAQRRGSDSQIGAGSAPAKLRGDHPRIAQAAPGQRMAAHPVTLTSIGPRHIRWAWLWNWAWWSITLWVPLWIVAASLGGSYQQQQRQMTQSKLRALLTDALARVRDPIEQARRMAVLMGRSDRVVDAARVRVETDQDNVDMTAMIPDQRDRAWQLSGRDAATPVPVKVAFWDREMRLIAVADSQSGQTVNLETGESVPPDGAATLNRALRGEVSLYGPLPESGLFDRQAAAGVTIGWVAPVRGTTPPDGGNRADENGPITRNEIQAVVFVGATRWYDELNSSLATFSAIHDVDAYLVNRDGWMLTRSRLVVENAISQPFSVRDPGDRGLTNDVTETAETPTDGRDVDVPVRVPLKAQFKPLTISASSVSLGQNERVELEAYRNYLGEPTQGAWTWINDYELGLIVEQSSVDVGGPLATVWPWAAALSVVFSGLAGLAAWSTGAKSRRQLSDRQPLGRYRIGEEIGRGGMGVVYLAEHVELGRQIAVKILQTDRRDRDDQQRFDREARLAATLMSPHSVTVFDYGRSETGDKFCAMQLLQGLTLWEVVARSGFQPVGRVIWILRQICQSIVEAHGRGLMHRDLKPQNVMLDFDRVVGDWAVVFDFGLAKPLQPDGQMFQTAETIWAGTPMYMAPERFRDPTVMDPRSDLYSIGCIAYCLLAGHPPFAECDPESMFALILSDRPLQIATHRGQPVDADVEKLVMRCMAKNKDDRFASAVELIDALDELSMRHRWSRDEAHQWWRLHAPEHLVSPT